MIIPLLNNGLYPIHDFYSEGGFHWIKTYLRYKNGETIGNVVFPIAIENKKMQEIGAQITYLKRYSLSIICNLSADSDNDGQEVVGQKIIKTITPAQIETIKKLLNGDENIGDMIKDKFKFKKVEAVSQDKFGTVVTFINLQNMQKGKSNVNSS